MAAAAIKKRWPSKKLVGTITYEPLLELHSNLVWLLAPAVTVGGTEGAMDSASVFFFYL